MGSGCAAGGESGAWSWSLVRRAIAVGLLTAASLALIVPPAGATAASISSDRAQAAQLERQISSQGSSIQRIVIAYDQAVSKADAIHAKLLTAQARYVSDQALQAQDAAQVRRVAVYDFVNSSNLDTTEQSLSTGSFSSLLIEQEYARVAGDTLQNAIDALELAKRQTKRAESTLVSEQDQAQAAVNLLSQEGAAAQVALQKDNLLLTSVRGNLKSLLAAAAKARAAAQAAHEQALAAEAAQAAPTASPLTLPTINPAPGTYANPLRDISALYPERIDQGVDFSGYGPIYAIGDGVVLSTVNAGWPGGTFIAYRLSDGPAQGLTVYAGEDILPSVQVGQTVTAGTQIGTMYEGPDGIETGWADPSGNGESMANDYGQFSGSNSSAFGANFSSFLQSVGGPAGVIQSYPPTGSLPSGWPAW